MQGRHALQAHAGVELVLCSLPALLGLFALGLARVGDVHQAAALVLALAHAHPAGVDQRLEVARQRRGVHAHAPRQVRGPHRTGGQHVAEQRVLRDAQPRLVQMGVIHLAHAAHELAHAVVGAALGHGEDVWIHWHGADYCIYNCCRYNNIHAAIPDSLAPAFFPMKERHSMDTRTHSPEQAARNTTSGAISPALQAWLDEEQAVTLRPGRGCTTAELGVNLVKALTPRVPRVRAEGRVLHCGRQLATAEARLVGPDGTLYAHATTTCLVFEMPPAR